MSFIVKKLKAKVEVLETELVQALVDLEVEKDLTARLVSQLETEIERRGHKVWWPEEITTLALDCGSARCGSDRHS
jgi:hypothetical protein